MKVTAAAKNLGITWVFLRSGRERKNFVLPVLRARRQVTMEIGVRNAQKDSSMTNPMAAYPSIECPATENIGLSF